MLGQSNNRWARQLRGGAPHFALGAWVPSRKLASIGYVPTAEDRAKINGGRIYDIVLPWSLTGSQTLEFQGVAPGQFALMAVIGNSFQSEGVQVSLIDPERKRALTYSPIRLGNFAGDAKHPFYLRKFYPFQPGASINARITNLSPNPNVGQLVLKGFIVSTLVDLGTPPMGNYIPGSLRSPMQIQERPWVTRPASGESFDPAQTVALPAVGATATILQFTVPSGRSGVIKKIANGYGGGNWNGGGGWNNGDQNLVWQIQINGVPYKNYDNITVSMGTPQQPREIGGIRLRENDVVSIVVTNVGVVAAAGPVMGSLGGWFYPTELDPSDAWG